MSATVLDYPEQTGLLLDRVMSSPADIELDMLSVNCVTGTIVEDVSFRLHPGRVTAMIGPSGSGKTTIIRAIAGLLDDDLNACGRLRMTNEVQDLKVPCRHRSGVAVVFQEPLNSLNPLLNMAFFLDEILRANRPEMREIDRNRMISETLMQVGLPSRVTDHLPSQLSGGERQRILVAAALLVGPKLLLADEPTGALDSVAKQNILELLVELSRRHEIPVLIATHDLRSIRSIADDIIVLSKGRIDKIIPVSDLVTPDLHSSQVVFEGGEHALEAIGVSKFFKNHQVLSGLSFTLEAGVTVGLTGRSGCGKSTLANCLAGLMSVDEGDIRLHSSDGLRHRIYQPGPRVQMIFQEPQSSFDPRWSVLRSTADAVRFAHPELSKNDCVRFALEVLLDAGLDEATVQRLPGEISGGECQRAAIARTLVGSPSVLIADEPVSSLDYEWEKRIFDLLLRYQEERKFTMLLISHDLLLLSKICSRIAVLGDGSIIEFEKPCELINSPRDPITIELVRAMPRFDT